MGQSMPSGGPPPPPPAPAPAAAKPSGSKLPGWAIAAIVTSGLLMFACLGGFTLLVFKLDRSDPPPAALAPFPSTADPFAPASPSAPAEPPPGPAPADQTFSGRGNKTIKFELDPRWTYIAKITHDGESNFVVESRDGSGRYVDMPVNAIGDYQGVRLLNSRLDETPGQMRIRARGSWKVTIQTADKAPKWTGKASGRGDTVLRVDPDAPEAEVRFTYRGEDNCSVIAYAESTDLLVNDIGKFTGDVTVPRGTRFIEVGAEAPWTLTAR